MCNAIETGTLKSQMEDYEEKDDEDEDEIDYGDTEKV